MTQLELYPQEYVVEVQVTEQRKYVVTANSKRDAELAADSLVEDHNYDYESLDLLVEDITAYPQED